MFIPIILNADSGGRFAADFMNIGIGGRPSSMSDTFCAVADNADAVYWNPAGLARLTDIELSFSHLDYIANIKFANFAAVIPMTNRVIGMNFNTMYTEDTERDINGNKTGSFMDINSVLSIAYSANLTDKTCFGISMKTVYIQLASEKTNGLVFDTGLLHRLTDKISLGINIQNVGDKIQYPGNDIVPPATNIKLGASYKTAGLLVATDVNIPIKGRKTLSIGAEHRIKQIFSLRYGYKFKEGGNELGAFDGVSVGFGLTIRKYTFDYAFSPFGEFGVVHRLSFNFRL
jgi:long-subunit fatty acid transport protein